MEHEETGKVKTQKTLEEKEEPDGKLLIVKSLTTTFEKMKV